MQTGTKEIGVILAVVLLAGLVTAVLIVDPSIGSRRGCGHVDERFRSVSGFCDWVTGTTHCCVGGQLVADLKMFYLAQYMFENDYRRFAKDVMELQSYLGGQMPNRHGTLQYSIKMNQWSVSVNKAGQLPGYYQLVNNRIYFDESRPATTNDLCLKEIELH